MFDIRKTKNKISTENCLRVFLLVLFISFWVSAQALADNGPSSETNSAHIKNKKPDSGNFVLENEISVKTRLPAIQFTSCQAYISLESQQRNTLARVVTTIEQKSCATSTGEYVLLVTIQDENGDSNNLSFSEIWEQKDNSPMKLSRDYPIGENVILKRIIAQRVRCECTDL